VWLIHARVKKGPNRDEKAPGMTRLAKADVCPFVRPTSGVCLAIGMLFYKGSGIIHTSAGNYQAEKGTLTLSASDPYGAIVGASVPENFYDVDADTFTATAVDLMASDVQMRVYSQGGNYRSVSLDVNAVLASGSSQDYAIFLPITTVIDLNERITDTKIDPQDIVFDQLLVVASSRETAGSVLDALTDLGYNTSGMGSFLSQVNDFFGTMRMMLAGVGGVALLVAAFGVANTMMMAILERTREIGLMKAVGATDGAILTIFLVEAGLVGLIGGTVGLSVCYLFQYAVNAALANMGNSSDTISFMNTTISVSQLGGNLIVIPAELAVAALAMAACIGVAAGLYPAFRAARMTTVLALRSE
jgi:ABC-type antimicrobial peptide transport system permease subunit